MKKKKKEKKRKENLHGSEQNVVGVKEIAQGLILSMLFRMDPNGLPDDRIQFKEVAYPVEQIKGTGSR